MATIFQCRCGAAIHRISAAGYLHDDGADVCADGGHARPALEVDMPAGYDPDAVLAVAS